MAQLVTEMPSVGANPVVAAGVVTDAAMVECTVRVTPLRLAVPLWLAVPLRLAVALRSCRSSPWEAGDTMEAAACSSVLASGASQVAVALVMEEAQGWAILRHEPAILLHEPPRQALGLGELSVELVQHTW